MLDEFLISHREEIIASARTRVVKRLCPKPSDEELRNGIPVFLDQLGDALRRAKSTDVVDHQEIDKSAGRHGHDLLRMGLTIGQVVHDYGDICQAITELALRVNAPISGQDFQILNLCLDDAIAKAVTVYSHQREREIEDKGTERLGVLAHELRNLLNAAVLSFASLKTGLVSVGGSTGLVHARSLIGMRDLIDRSLADVRLDAGIGALEPISVAELTEEIEITGLLQAQVRGIDFTVSSVERTLTIEGDRQIVAAALSNLLQNAFKFTPKGGRVSLTVSATEERVLFEVEDQCGGLPPGKIQELFEPFEQRGADRTGLGLGLSIAMKAARASAGEIRARDLPGQGCVFTLDLPRKPPPPLALVEGGKSVTSAPPSAKPKATGTGRAPPTG